MSLWAIGADSDSGLIIGSGIVCSIGCAMTFPTGEVSVEGNI